MKHPFKLIALLLLGISVVFFVGCEDENDDDVSPLVGTWVMSNMEQTALYTAAADVANLGISAGDTLGGGTVPWAAFSALGITAEAELFDDGTYTLTGTFPDANDTLGFDLGTVDLDDAGDWSGADDLSTLLLDGSIYVIPPSGVAGPITVDDVDNPTTIDMTYADQETITVVLPVDANGDGVPDMFVADVPVINTSSTTLGFTKQ